MRLRGLSRERVMACILRILSTCFMRPGSQVYARRTGRSDRHLAAASRQRAR